MYHDKTMLQFLAVNLLVATILVVLGLNGILGSIIMADSSRISWVILAVGGLAVLLSLVRCIQLSRDLNSVHSFAKGRVRDFFALIEQGYDEAFAADVVREKYLSRLTWIVTAAGCAVYLGLIGTMYGIILATDISVQELASIDQIGPVIGKVLSGIRIALVTTLVGISVKIYLDLVVTILEIAVTRIYTKLIEFNKSSRNEGIDPDVVS